MNRTTRHRETKRPFTGELSEEAQKFIKQSVESSRQKLEAGDYSVILIGMWLCTYFRMQPPRWLVDAFGDRISQPAKFKTWDEAFGPPMPKGTKKARREVEVTRDLLALKIHQLRAKGVRGQALYEQANAELGLGSRSWEAVRDTYYRESKKIRDVREAAFNIIKAAQREKIYSSDVQLMVSPEEFNTWVENYFKMKPRDDARLQNFFKKNPHRLRRNRP